MVLSAADGLLAARYAQPCSASVYPGERTFFSWLRVALLLGSFALALFNGGDKIGSRMGMVYAIISMGMVSIRKQERIAQHMADHTRIR